MSLVWIARVAGGAVWVGVIVAYIRRRFGGTLTGIQHEWREVNQSLVADVAGYAATLLLGALVVCLPSTWAPRIVPQIADALGEAVAGQPGDGLAWVAAKTFGGIGGYLWIRYQVGNFKNPH